MQAIAINGSPRKNWNTATLLEQALKGAEKEGFSTELIHLHSLQYKGCYSCFACKELDGKSYGKCAVQDELSPILERMSEADTLIFGSPIYFFDVTGALRSLMERFLFQFYVYDEKNRTLRTRQIPSAFIYTMGSPTEVPFQSAMDSLEMFTQVVLGPVHRLMAKDTCQFKDYAKYYAPRFDVEHKKRQKKEAFPLACQKAVELGRMLAHLCKA